MGQPGGGHAPSLPAEFIGRRAPTGGTETSQYPEEEKAKAIPLVAASERGTAQTVDMSSPCALCRRGRGACLHWDTAQVGVKEDL